VGKDPDQIEREIRDYRGHIGDRIDGLQKRVRSDIETAQSEAKQRVNTTMEDTKQTLKPQSLMDEHPLSSVAGALGIGVLLGVASEGFSSGGKSDGNSASNGRRDGNGESALSGLLGSIVGPAARTAQDELQHLVKQGFSAVREQASQMTETDPRVQNRDVGVE
jgi:ElaB/YqjD/DUF883 family membrane-anchored ribosome-binding protein